MSIISSQHFPHNSWTTLTFPYRLDPASTLSTRSTRSTNAARPTGDPHAVCASEHRTGGRAAAGLAASVFSEACRVARWLGPYHVSHAYGGERERGSVTAPQSLLLTPQPSPLTPHPSPLNPHCSDQPVFTRRSNSANRHQLTIVGDRGGNGGDSDGGDGGTFTSAKVIEPSYYPSLLTSPLRRFAPHQPRIDHILYYEGERCDLLEVRPWVGPPPQPQPWPSPFI